jgi:hypothetical protein
LALLFLKDHLWETFLASSHLKNLSIITPHFLSRQLLKVFNNVHFSTFSVEMLDACFVKKKVPKVFDESLIASEGITKK